MPMYTRSRSDHTCSRQQQWPLVATVDNWPAGQPPDAGRPVFASGGGAVGAAGLGGGVAGFAGGGACGGRGGGSSSTAGGGSSRAGGLRAAASAWPPRATGAPPQVSRHCFWSEQPSSAQSGTVPCIVQVTPS